MQEKQMALWWQLKNVKRYHYHLYLKMIIKGITIDTAVFDYSANTYLAERLLIKQLPERGFYRLLCKIGH